MAYIRKTIDEKEIERQQAVCARIFERVTADGARPLAMVDTYGCQQNEADSEKLRGYLAEMGYGFTQDEFQADVIVVNTCAVREHAEMRVLGNVGALTHSKKARPGQIIAVCGCMVQQEHMAQKIKMSYPVVDLVFGPHELWRFPELLEQVMEKHRRVFAAEKNDGAVAEGIPVRRDGKVKAWLSIMYGCNNFCTYCIVPYVRGRERSRLPEDVAAEARELVAAGYKDITLLGQNVNSYGKDLEENVEPAGPVRQRPDLKADEPPLRPRKVPIGDRDGAALYAGHRHHDGHHRGLPRRDGGGLCRHALAVRGGALRRDVHLYLLQARRHARGDDAGSLYARGQAEALRRAHRAYTRERPSAFSSTARRARRSTTSRAARTAADLCTCAATRA